VRRAERLRPLELRLDARALLGRHTGREEHRVDAELPGEPGDRRRRRARLPALDLADVLLREPLARELRLGQPGGARSVRTRSPRRVPEGGACIVTESCMPLSVK
jgi:hypothetical protein